MNTFRLIISSPEEKCFDDEIQSVSLRGICGDLKILKGHIPFVTQITPGGCVITKKDGTKTTARINGGFLYIENNKSILISHSVTFE